jgi:hypothetical protein
MEWKDASIENFTAMICWHPRLFLHEHHITPFDTDMNEIDTSSGEARVIHGYGWASNVMGFFLNTAGKMSCQLLAGNWNDSIRRGEWLVGSM